MQICGMKVVLLCFQSRQINNVEAIEKTEQIVIDNINVNKWGNIEKKSLGASDTLHWQEIRGRYYMLII